MKICVYTCITGGYDMLKDPVVVTKDVDYICFCDRPFNSKVWKCRPIPDDLQTLDNVRRQRLVKILPHKYLSEYDVSVWLDGSFTIISDVHDFIAQYDLDKYSMYSRKHPKRDCIYGEANECLMVGKGNRFEINAQMCRYKKEKFPEHNGLIESGILLRKHNDFNCKIAMNYWAAEIMSGCIRDQLSFNYVAWKRKFKYGILANEAKLNDNKFVKISPHNR